MSAHLSKESVEPAKFEPYTDPKLQRRVKALEAEFERVRKNAAETGKLLAPAAATRRAARLLRRIEAAKTAIAESHRLQELAFRRRVPPARSVKREARRAAEKVFGALSGRQWVRLRKMLKRRARVEGA